MTDPKPKAMSAKEALKRLGPCVRVAHSHGVMVMGKDESRAALATLEALAESEAGLRAENKRLQRQVGIEQRKVSDLDGLLTKYHEAAEKAEAELARCERRYAELVEMTATRTDQAKEKKE